MSFVHIARSAARRVLRGTPPRDKYTLEEAFWRTEIDRIRAWYRGELAVHYRTPSPRPDERIDVGDEDLAAVLTWFKLHQKPKYAVDLELPADIFRGLRVLDVGAGPMPSAEVFTGCDLYCLDPLYPRYLQAGWPIHIYGPRTWFVHGRSESMPLEDDFFDAVISVNAIDHVDNFEATAREIQRVLRPGGKLCLHVHYHPPTGTEPLQLDDTRVFSAFSWCSGFRKIRETSEKSSASVGEGEAFALWTNIEL